MDRKNYFWVKKMRKLLVIILFTVSAVQINAQICKVLVVKQYLYSDIKNHKTDTATGILRIEGDTCIVTHDAIKKDGFGAYISKNAVFILLFLKTRVQL